jgi:hypothetical protein
MTIFHRGALAALTMVAASVLPACANDDWAQKAVNDPANLVGLWGNAKLDPLSEPAAPGGAFTRITIEHQPLQPGHVGAYVMITKPVKKGDVLLAVIWARAAQPPVQNDFIATHGQFNETAPPNRAISDETPLVIGKDWKRYYLEGTADRDFAPGTLSASIILGTGEQTIDFASPFIVDYGPGYDTNKLPHN